MPTATQSAPVSHPFFAKFYNNNNNNNDNTNHASAAALAVTPSQGSPSLAHPRSTIPIPSHDHKSLGISTDSSHSSSGVYDREQQISFALRADQSRSFHSAAAASLFPHLASPPAPASAISSSSPCIPYSPFGPGFAHVPASPAPPTPSSVIASSPAAMFLSAFSSPATPKRLPDDEGETVAGYTLAGIIGYGGFSTIRRAYSTSSGAVVAVKIVKRADLTKQEHGAKSCGVSAAEKRLEREREIWSTLSHEHILPLFTAVKTSYAYFFVTLYCPAGSLFDILTRDGRPALPQDDVGMMFRQIVRGLRYLHESVGMVHRDIKLENVLVDEMGVCRIADFGMMVRIGEQDENGVWDDDDDDDETQQCNNNNNSSNKAFDLLNRQEFGNGAGGLHRSATISVSSSKYLPTRSSCLSPFFPSARSTSSSYLDTKSTSKSHLIPNGTPGVLRHRNSTSTATTSAAQPNFKGPPGSLPYAAPELLSPRSSVNPALNGITHPNLLPSAAQDIWALGVMLHALLVGHLPFRDSLEPRLMMKILNGAFRAPRARGRDPLLVISLHTFFDRRS